MRVCSKEKFVNFCQREDKEGGRSPEETTAALSKVMGDNYGMLYEAMCYYGALGREC